MLVSILVRINIFVGDIKIKLNHSFLKSDENGKKSQILTVEIIDREEYVITSKKETFHLNRIALAIDASEHALIVYSDERAALLESYFELWNRRKKEHKASGLRTLAYSLCAFIDFRSAENEETSIGVSAIEKELFTLKKNRR